MARATCTALASPSIVNDTPESRGREACTNVISGCTDATAALSLRRALSSSLAKAPLECNATFPFQSAAVVKDRAAVAIARSGTQNQTTSESIRTRDAGAADAATSFASRRARCREAPPAREIIVSITNRPPCKATAKDAAKFPAPTSAILGFTFDLRGMPGRITDCAMPPVDRLLRRARVFHLVACFILFSCPRKCGAHPVRVNRLPVPAPKRESFSLARFIAVHFSGLLQMRCRNRVGFAPDAT